MCIAKHVGSCKKRVQNSKHVKRENNLLIVHRRPTYGAHTKKWQNAQRNRVFDGKEQRSLFPTVSVAPFLNMSQHV